MFLRLDTVVTLNLITAKGITATYNLVPQFRFCVCVCVCVCVCKGWARRTFCFKTYA